MAGAIDPSLQALTLVAAPGADVQKNAKGRGEDREAVRVRREAWVRERVSWNPARLVCLDEMGLTTALVRRHGWGRPHRVTGESPRQWITVLHQTDLTAPRVTEGPMTFDLLPAYGREFLAPTLSSGDRVICDHLASLLGTGVREAIEARGAIFLPLPP